MSNIVPLLFSATFSAAAAFNAYAGVVCLRGNETSTKLIGVGMFGFSTFIGLEAVAHYQEATQPPPRTEFTVEFQPGNQ